MTVAMVFALSLWRDVRKTSPVKRLSGPLTALTSVVAGLLQKIAVAGIVIICVNQR